MPRYSPVWPTDDDLARLARAQEGIVGRPQLHALGLSRHHVRHQVAAGRWRPVGSHAIALHTGALSPSQRRWAALLNSGPGSALCGLTAAALDGLVGFETSDIHLMVAHGIRVTPLPGVVVHTSRRFDPTVDIHPARRPARTRLPRSLADAAGWTADPIRACALLAAAVQQGLTTVGRLREALDATPRSRHRQLLYSALGDIEGGSQSFAEIDAFRLCRSAGLPGPSRQAARTDGDGRRRYLDLFWEDYGVCAEIDGRFHMRERDWRLDMDRQNEIVADGIRMLRFAAVTLRVHPQRFVEQVARAIGASQVRLPKRAP